MIAKIIKAIISWLGKFFSRKEGKIVAAGGAATGVAAAAVGARKVARSKKVNCLAEEIKAKAIKEHNEGKEKTDAVMAELGSAENSARRHLQSFLTLLK